MPFGLCELNTQFEDGRVNYKMSFLKINKLLEYCGLMSDLFHLMIVDGKKEFLKKLCLGLKKGLETFLVVYNECLAIV